MGYVQWNCPKCGNQNGEKCNAWVYGSPIRYCKKCKGEYFDGRWTEVAIDGLDKRSGKPGTYAIFAVVCLAFSAVCGLWMMTSIRTRGYYISTQLLCVLAGIIGAIGSVVMIIRSVSGYEDKQNQKYYEESVARLKDKAYVEKLEGYGFRVPDEFKN